MRYRGKNIVSLMQVWMVGRPLHWPIGTQARQSIVYGVFQFISGRVLTPVLMRALGQRGFTSLTNVLNAVGTALMGLPLGSFGRSFWLGHVVHLPGINNTSASAVKAWAIDHAVAAGFGRGEWGGIYSSIRTFSQIVAPLVYTTAYARGGGACWFTVALLGAVLPECLHRCLGDDELFPAVGGQSTG